MERTGSSLEFGIRMRGMRNAVGLTAKDVAELLNCSESLIYSIEGGYRTISPMSLSGLLSGPYQQASLIPEMTKLLNEAISGVDRPIKDSPAVHPNMMFVHELEPRASAAYGMIIDQIPKLCQLPECMRAQHRMAGLDADKVEGLTLAGMQRQERFFSLDNPPHTSIIITEGALDRGQQIDGQMAFLLDRAQHDSLSIYLIPHALGPQPVFCSFTVMAFGEFPGVLWMDSPTGGMLSTKAEEITEAKQLWDRLSLSQIAKSPDETLSIIQSRC